MLDNVYCSEPYCKQLDILPFQCDLCKKSYCLDHFRPEAHHCPLAGKNDRRVITCPLCMETVNLLFNEPPDITWKNHQNTTCNPKLYQARQKFRQGRYCPVPLCKERLTFASSYECRQCNATVCLKHRYPTDHQCSTASMPAIHNASHNTVGTSFWKKITGALPWSRFH